VERTVGVVECFADVVVAQSDHFCLVELAVLEAKDVLHNAEEMVRSCSWYGVAYSPGNID
jgi:hypothetical protein